MQEDEQPSSSGVGKGVEVVGTPSPELEHKLRALRDMGFHDDATNVELLQDKSVEEVALYLSASDKL